MDHQTAQAYYKTTSTARPSPSARRCGYAALPESERRAKAAALAARGRRLAGPRDGRPLQRHRRRPGVPGQREARSTRRAGHLVPGPLLRTKIRPLLVDWDSATGIGETLNRVSCTRRTGRTTRAYYDRQRDCRLAAIRGADPVDRAGPRVWACSPSARTSRPPGSPASSTSTRSRHARRQGPCGVLAIDEAEKFRIEYWPLEEAKSGGGPSRRSDRIALVTGAPPASARRSRPASPRARASSSPTST